MDKNLWYKLSNAKMFRFNDLFIIRKFGGNEDKKLYIKLKKTR